MVAEAADDYRYIALLWPALAALLLPAILLTAAPAIDAWLLYLAQTALFVALALLAQLPPLRMALVPAATKRQRAGRLAREQFFAQGLHLTRERTGVLIFVAVAEHHVEIIADQGIDARGAGRHLGRGGGRVHRAGARRARRRGLSRDDRAWSASASPSTFPRADDDLDELPNRLIEI